MEIFMVRNKVICRSFGALLLISKLSIKILPLRGLLREMDLFFMNNRPVCLVTINFEKERGPKGRYYYSQELLLDKSPEGAT